MMMLPMVEGEGGGETQAQGQPRGRALVCHLGSLILRTRWSREHVTDYAVVGSSRSKNLKIFLHTHTHK